MYKDIGYCHTQFVTGRGSGKALRDFALYYKILVSKMSQNFNTQLDSPELDSETMIEISICPPWNLSTTCTVTPVPISDTSIAVFKSFVRHLH